MDTPAGQIFTALPAWLRTGLGRGCSGSPPTQVPDLQLGETRGEACWLMVKPGSGQAGTGSGHLPLPLALRFLPQAGKCEEGEPWFLRAPGLSEGPAWLLVCPLLEGSLSRSLASSHIWVTRRACPTCDVGVPGRRCWQARGRWGNPKGTWQDAGRARLLPRGLGTSCPGCVWAQGGGLCVFPGRAPDAMQCPHALTSLDPTPLAACQGTPAGPVPGPSYPWLSSLLAAAGWTRRPPLPLLVPTFP